MSFVLDQDQSIPLYRRLRRAIEEAVSEGRFQHSHLPSSRSLSVELGVSRTTVNLAYQELVAEGFILGEPRVGYSVNAELVSRLESHAPLAPVYTNDPASISWDDRLVNRTSAIPEVVKDRNWQSYEFPFIYGQVPSGSFPVSAWNRALREAMNQPHLNFSLRDAGSEDDPFLIQQLCERILPGRGITANPNQVLITHGAQHGVFLCSRVFVRPGDDVAVENPGYPDSNHILSRAGARIVPVDVDGSGIIVSELPDRASIVSVTPSHQFPTNVGLSVARRAELLDFATSNDSFIVEDDYDSELRYVGQPAPALRSNGHNRVVYIASFSKFLAPGLRMGYVVAEEPVIERMREERRYSLRHPPGQTQRALAILIQSGDYHRSLRRQRTLLKEKWRRMTHLVRQGLGWEFEMPTGGTSLWVTTPPGVSASDLAEEAAKSGVLVEPGSQFYLGSKPDLRKIRLGFSAIPLERIEPGLRALSAAAERVARGPHRV